MKQLFQAVSRSSEGAFILNDRQEIVFWNEAAQKLLGFSADELLNHPCYDILCGIDEKKRTICQRYCRVAITILHGGSPPNMDLFARTKDGQRRWINITTLAFPTENEELGHFIVHVFRDATQKKNNERFIEEIMTATRELQNEKEPSSISMIPAETLFASEFETLTSREREVLLLMAHGLATDEMANMLSISTATTRNHIQNIMEKLGVHSRLEAVAFTYQHGLIELNGQ